MTDEPAQPVAQPTSSGPSFLTVLIFVAAAGWLLSLYIRGPAQRGGAQPTGLIGRPAPELRVAGWINGPGPSAADLQGKIVVVDAWAYWCGPCRKKAPELIALYNKYKDRGVVFLGLTHEGPEALRESERFVRDTKLTWPQGYGADQMLGELEAHYIPQLWVFGPDSRIAWDQTSDQSIEAVLDQLLASGPAASATPAPGR